MTQFNSFDQMALPEALKRALGKMGLKTPTPIQAQAIPLALSRRDLIGCAQTGTGKTAAFLLPTLTHLLSKPQAKALILVPTRELADQVQEVMEKLLSASPDLRSTQIIGGVPMRGQIRNLARSPRAIVATPGRLADHLRQGTISLKTVEVLVLDEADRMLDMGFMPQLLQILRYLPRQRQTLLFSATVPPNILSLAKKFLHDPAQVRIGPVKESKPLIGQKTIQVSQKLKNETLVNELNARAGSVLVFARTKSRTNRVSEFLESYGFPVERIHGGRTQAQRRKAIEGFRKGDIRILIATDIAARGIDVAHIAHIINYDLPQDPQDYIHRIGRTGRAGKSGEALSFVTPEDKRSWFAITRLFNGGRPRPN